MGGASSSGSFLTNTTKRRDSLNKTRQQLLDRPGLPPKSKSTPPPAVPAGDKKDAKRNALEKVQEREDQPGNVLKDDRRAKTGVGDNAEGRIDRAVIGLDEETKADMMEQATQFLKHVRRVKRAQLHKTVGRARKFWGGGF